MKITKYLKHLGQVHHMQKKLFLWPQRLGIVKAVGTIIPNNREISFLLSLNSYLLNEDERILLEEFKLHKDGFEYNHLSADKSADYPLISSKANKNIGVVYNV